MKKFLASLMAVSMIASMSAVAFAAVPTGYNDDDDKADIDANGSTTFENVRPAMTYWIPLNQIVGVNAVTFPSTDWNVTDSTSADAINELGDTDLFKWSFDKDGDGSKLIKSITVVNDKKVDNNTVTTGRTTYLKVVTNQTFDDGEKKAKVDVEIKPKKSKGTDYDYVFTSGSVNTSEKAKFSLTFWVSNAEVDGEDADVETGDGFVFNPTDNENNTIVYGDDRAAIYFSADDDASKFYAKLSTKSMSDIYVEYGDPVDADLWFYDFVGNKTIPSTSRATLTLGIPWDEDDDYVPDPTNVYIYELVTNGTLSATTDNAGNLTDGRLVDVTDKFTYSEDNDSTTGIEGWSIKTRTLGTYIVSDTELDLDVVISSSEDEAPASSSSSTDDNKGIPNTGSSDMVNVAVMAAVVSLAAAGAVAFKKASK